MHFDEIRHARIVGQLRGQNAVFCAIIAALFGKTIDPAMQLLIDFLPIVLFFAAYFTTRRLLHCPAGDHGSRTYCASGLFSG